MTHLREQKQTMKHAVARPMRGCVLVRVAGDGVHYSEHSFRGYYGDSINWDTSNSLTKQCFLPRANKVCPQRHAEMRKGSDNIYYVRADFAKRFKNAQWAAAGSTAIKCSLTKSDFSSPENCTQRLGGGAAAQDLPGGRPISFSNQAVEGTPPKSRESCLSPAVAPCRSKLGPDAAPREGSMDSSGGSLSSAPTDGELYTAFVDSEVDDREGLWSAESVALAGMLAAALKEASRLAAERDSALRDAAEARKAEAAARAAAEAAAQREQELCAQLAALRQDASAWASRDQASKPFPQRRVIAEEKERRDTLIAYEVDFRGFFSSSAEATTSGSDALGRCTGSAAPPAASAEAASPTSSPPHGEVTGPPPQREWTASEVFSVKKIAHWVAGFDPQSWELVNRASLRAACKVTHRWMKAYDELCFNAYSLQATREQADDLRGGLKEPGLCTTMIDELDDLRDDVEDSFRGHEYRVTFILRIDLLLAIFELFRQEWKEIWLEACHVTRHLTREVESMRYILGFRQQGVYGNRPPPGNVRARAPRRPRQ
eukprot:TRINITY_DN10498_c0_g2_i3.p1 TRINITY_DN10498_c0_g2~~TRINITY_DN10498_c0_g2_i3.p1  ORF type:complete len:544 (+),score=119.52 TRINITY_DN10498_c0_g2_i3:83-1714(+)